MGKFIFIFFYFDLEKLHEVHWCILYIYMLMFKIHYYWAAEISLTRSKINLLCTGGGEVSDGGLVVNKLNS